MTPKQRQALDFIIAYQAGHGGVSPSLSDMCAGLGYSPKTRASVSGLLDGLEREGFITRHPRRRRSITVVATGAAPDWTELVKRAPSHILHAELERRDGDPAWQTVVACDCGHRAGSPQARDCQRHICPMRAREAA